MAETVEQILERQIPSLQDLVDRRIMTVSEVKSLVEQRRSFEYRLARRAARKVQSFSLPRLFNCAFARGNKN
jgi:hypothetical protein